MYKDDIDKIIDFYNDCQSLRETAKYFEIHYQTVRKILITYSDYTTDKSEYIQFLLAQEMTVQEIARKLNITTSAVSAHIPYHKGIYKLEDATRNAIYIRRHRDKKKGEIHE